MRYSILLATGFVLFIGCGGIEASGATAAGGVADSIDCAVTATITTPWTGSSALPLDSGGQDASLWLALAIPNGSIVKRVSAIVAPAHGHAAMPERLPRFTVSDEGGGAVDALGAALDTAADVGTYEDEHKIALDVTKVSWAPPEGHEQWILFDSEGGAAALPGLQIRGWVCE